MRGNQANCNVTILGAGPYGLSAAAFLNATGVETRIFGEPMAFWERQMPAGMCLRSSWDASHIADPSRALTLDEYCRENGNHKAKPIPLDRFVAYGHWYQRHAVQNLENRQVRTIEKDPCGFKVSLAGGEQFTSKRVVVAAGISSFAARPAEFDNIPSELASHSSEHDNLQKFKGKQLVVVGAGQSALESAALFHEFGISVEVIARDSTLNWVGLHPRLHRLGIISQMLYSKHDVGPAGLSRLVAMPYLFRKFPRRFQDRSAYRAIRPAGAGWLRPRLTEVPITLGRKILSANPAGSRLQLRLDDGTERVVDHALLATGFRVDVCRYPFLSQSLSADLKTSNGYPILQHGLESSIPGLHFLGKPAAWSFGPLLGFVSGAEFAATELVKSIRRENGKH